MSFEAVWGFDPEQVLKAQNLFRTEFVRQPGKDEVECDGGVEGMRIPLSADAQLYELRRICRNGP